MEVRLPGVPTSGRELHDRFTGICDLASVGKFRFLDRGIVFVLFPLLVGVFFLPLLGDGKILAVTDSDAACEWWWKRQFLGDALRQLRLPQWNPYAMAGAPFLATSQ